MAQERKGSLDLQGAPADTARSGERDVHVESGPGLAPMPPRMPSLEVARRPRRGAVGSQAVGALAIGALAVGALAVGALAIGRLAVGRMQVSRFHGRRLRIDELDIGRLRIGELIGPGAERVKQRTGRNG